MNSKTLLQQNKPLSAWWSGIVDDPKFEQVLLHVAAASFEAYPSQEKRDGVMLTITLLQTICQAEEQPVDAPTPHLQHNLELKRKSTSDK